MVKRQVSFKINNDIDKWVQDQTDSKDGNKAPFESVSDLVNTALQYYKNRKEFEASMQETILTFMKSNPAVKKELERLMREIISQKSR
ncbi:MAG: hypothetical protein ABSG06_10875 [Methanoregula sp.]|jgi:Arc/MetJ-type ribon-helix-helix transcriptional regulator